MTNGQQNMGVSHEIDADTAVPGRETRSDAPPLRVDFSGEVHVVQPGQSFTIGREGDLEVDDNPYLHRTFLELAYAEGLWWLSNIGSRLSATVSSAGGAVQSWLSPGARLPVVFEHSVVVFTAGPTTYEVALNAPAAQYAVSSQVQESISGETTVMPVRLTPSQKQLIVALAEPMLRREGVSVSDLPSSATAAKRLGWSMSKFNRKLDNVCDKLDRMGVQGLRGSAGKLAMNRRARLVEYAVSSQLVGRADLPLLDAGDLEDD
ncbi:hypothetical protein [Microbacterium excoecariae]|uniref:hypothetical protein n=1 Tax=Microbacterium excoecariae TaxID=2715210 RepID=UPI001F1037FF|nr:hypothetical protein [Microbacterium excoecariae]